MRVKLGNISEKIKFDIKIYEKDIFENIEENEDIIFKL
jgi:hypothetical protein